MSESVSRKLLSEGQGDRTYLYELPPAQTLREHHPGCRVVLTVLSGEVHCGGETLGHGAVRLHDGDLPLELRGGAQGGQVLVTLVR